MHHHRTTFPRRTGPRSSLRTPHFLFAPRAPSVGQRYTTTRDVVYEWDGQKWVAADMFERISCPSCGRVQDAILELGGSFVDPTHQCEACDYLIDLVEWRPVP